MELSASESPNFFEAYIGMHEKGKKLESIPKNQMKVLNRPETQKSDLKARLGLSESKNSEISNNLKKKYYELYFDASELKKLTKKTQNGVLFIYIRPNQYKDRNLKLNLRNSQELIFLNQQRGKCLKKNNKNECECNKDFIGKYCDIPLELISMENNQELNRLIFPPKSVKIFFFKNLYNFQKEKKIFDSITLKLTRDCKTAFSSSQTDSKTDNVMISPFLLKSELNNWIESGKSEAKPQILDCGLFPKLEIQSNLEQNYYIGKLSL